MKAALTGYLYLPKRSIPGLAKLRSNLCARSRYDPEYCVYAYDDKTNAIGIPINYDPSIWARITKLHDLRSEGSGIAIDLQTELYDYQQNAFDEIVENIDQGATNFIFQGRTGWGKTILAAAIISRLKKTTLIVVPVTTLIHQWKAELLTHTDLTEEDIGIASDAKVSWAGKKVVIGLVHTLVLDRWGEDFKKHFGFILLDEVDRSAPPETFSPICTLFPAKIRMAMSATLKRKDRLDKVFHWHFGGVYIDGNKHANIRVKTAKALSVLYPEKDLPTYVEKIKGKIQRRGALISALSKDDHRNVALCSYIKKFYNTKRPTMILSDRIDQLIYLASIMEQKYKIPVREMGFFIRAMPTNCMYRKTPQDKLKDKMLIFGTYKMLDIGFDMKPLSGLVLATPRSSIEQTVGRVERFLEGKQQPVVVDFLDIAIPDAINWSHARRKEYDRLGIPVTERRHV